MPRTKKFTNKNIAKNQKGIKISSSEKLKK